LGCWGLLLNSHQTTAEALQVALIGFVMYRLVRYLAHPGIGNALYFGLALAALTLTRGWWPPLVLWLISLLCAFFPNTIRTRQILLHMLLALLCALAILFVWRHFHDPASFAGWQEWNLAQLTWPNLKALNFLFRYGMWFFWPAWPFALWAIYAWRRQRYALHIALPFACILGLGSLSLMAADPAENYLLPFLPPLAILAAFGLPTMKRGAINAVDWFALMTITTGATLIWLAWLALLTGWPAQLAKNTLKLVPGFVPEFEPFAVVVAVVVSIAWICLIYWRVSRQPPVLWRAVVLSTGGVILCWLQLMTLFLPWSDYRLSYAPVARQIAKRLPLGTDCILSNVSPAQRASFAYFGALPFAPIKPGKLPRCKILLLQDHVQLTNSADLAKEFRGNQWQLLWEGRRAADRDERFRLYRRR
jgi:4-amino-4-deoxy-L-arabinose transferase-like glycosyltransferase